MMFMSLAAAALAATASTTAIPAPPHSTAEPAPQPIVAVNAVPVSSMPAKPDLAQMLAMFDKMFPAGPAPDPARLVLARTTVETLWPNGTYGRMTDQLMGGIYDRIMAMKLSDFDKGAAKAGKPGPDLTLHQSMLKDDPYFDQRVAIIRRVMTDEMKALSAIVEPRLRDGLARAAARRFDARQLTDINTFFATDSGRALGSNLITIWMDPDTIRGVVQSMPDLIAEMPQMMARVEQATKALPKPRTKTEPVVPKPKPKH